MLKLFDLSSDLNIIRSPLIKSTFILSRYSTPKFNLSNDFHIGMYVQILN